MKRLAVALLLMMFSTVSLALEKVQFAIGDWAPYTSESNPDGKVAEKIVMEALALEGVQVEFTYNSWSDSYDQVKLGQADGTFPWYLNEERFADFLFSDPLLADNQVFFHLKSNSFDWTGFEDLKKYTIAGTKAYSHVSDLQSHGIEPVISEDEKDSFRKVLSGEVDAYPASKIVGQQMINSLFSDEDAAKFTTHTIPMTVDNMFLLVSRKVPNGKEIVEVFNSGLLKLKSSGRYQQILDEI